MTQFSDLNLDPKVLQAVVEAGYETPTPIQAGAIPHALEGRDVLGIAQTGTGKTASFTLPMITMLQKGRARARMPRSLVLCPTRELAAQVAENFDTYAKHTKLTKALLIGGVSFKEQDTLIDRGVDVLIATPGRLLDHFERGKLLLTGVQIMVVDEADRMLDMGFIPDIERIFKLTPFTRQTMFYSATMAPEIERITNELPAQPREDRGRAPGDRLRDDRAGRGDVPRQQARARGVGKASLAARPDRRRGRPADQRDRLLQPQGRCRHRRQVLKKYGYDAAAIHGDLDQSQRTRTLDGFRDKTLRLLVASDVAARGLDIPAVSHVFNFDVPSHAEDYVHRIGRTGRAGRAGKAMMICSGRDQKYFDAVEALLQNADPARRLAPRHRPEHGRGRRAVPSRARETAAWRPLYRRARRRAPNRSQSPSAPRRRTSPEPAPRTCRARRAPARDARDRAASPRQPPRRPARGGGRRDGRGHPLVHRPELYRARRRLSRAPCDRVCWWRSVSARQRSPTTARAW